MSHGFYGSGDSQLNLIYMCIHIEPIPVLNFADTYRTVFIIVSFAVVFILIVQLFRLRTELIVLQLGEERAGAAILKELVVALTGVGRHAGGQDRAEGRRDGRCGAGGVG